MLDQLLSDIGSIWAKYGTVYLTGIGNTLILATVSTLIGCVIGFFCGILQTIPCGPNEKLPKRIFYLRHPDNMKLKEFKAVAEM